MNKKKRVSKLDTRFLNLIEYFLIAILVLLTLTFIFYPIVCVILRSFFPQGDFTLDLYRNIFQSNKKLLYNSLFVSGLATIISTFLATIISIYTTFLKLKIKKLVLFILMLSMISPPFISSIAYIQLFGKRGFITHDILGLTLNPYGWQGIVTMQSLSMTALSTLILIGIIGGINKNLLNASLDLGSSSSYTIYKILIPLMKPGIIVCALLSFVRCLSDFGTPMTIGGSFNVIATEIYMKIIAYGDLNGAAAMNVLILIPALLAFYIYRHYMKDAKLMSKATDKSVSEHSSIKLKGSLKFIFSFITFSFLVVMLLQYITIFISALTKSSYGKLYFTTENIDYLKTYSYDSLVRSVVYSLIVGFIGSILGILISYYVERRKIWGMKSLDFISTLPYIIPGTFFGIGYILAFNNEPLALTGTAAIVVLNCIFKQLPMTTKTGSAVLSQVSSEIESSAKDLGASNLHVLKDIVVPNAKPAFIAGFVNNFTTTMTTVGAIIFLIYPGQKVATIELFDAINSGKMGVASAIASVIIIITLIINIGLTRIVLGRSDNTNVS